MSESIMEDIYCNQCESLIADGEQFCGECGTKALHTSVTEEPAVAKPSAKKLNFQRTDLDLGMTFLEIDIF